MSQDPSSTNPVWKTTIQGIPWPSKTVREIYDGSNGEATKDLYIRLGALGPVGEVALNLFRAQKCSTRAKVYRGRSYKADAYDRKNWSLANLCAVLAEYDKGNYSPGVAGHTPIRWGWKRDPAASGPHCWVLYVDLILGGSQNCSKPGCGYGDGQPCIGCGHVVPPSQVSFHSATRGTGPDYPGDWDRSHASAQRIVNWCEDLLGEKRTPFTIERIVEAVYERAAQQDRLL